MKDDAEWTRIHGVMAAQLAKFQQKGGNLVHMSSPAAWTNLHAFQVCLGVVGDLGPRSSGVAKVCNESGTFADRIWTCRAHVEGRGPNLS